MTATSGPELFAAEDVPEETRLQADALWSRRGEVLSVLDSMPQVLSHGDALPRNLLRHDGPIVTAVDWDQLGYAPVGADLATFSMWVEEPIESLMASYLDGLRSSWAIETPALRDSVALTTSLIAISRAVRTAGGEQFGGYRDRLVKATPQIRIALQAIR